MLSDDELKKFKGLLDEQYEWPTNYLFKFVVPGAQADKIKALFPGQEVSERASKTGKYVSLSIDIKLESADVVIAIYQKASEIEGLISL